MTRTLGIALGLVCLVGVLPFVLACGGCNPSPSTPPEPTGCASPAPMGVVTALELGDTSLGFLPSTHLARVAGGQGLPMVAFRIGVRASAPVTCIAQSTMPGGSSFTSSLAVHADGDWYVTDSLYVIGSMDTLHVVATAYGLTVDRTMSTFGGPLEAGVGADAGL